MASSKPGFLGFPKPFDPRGGAGALIKLAAGVVAGAVTLDVVWRSFAPFKNKRLVLTSWIPSADGVLFNMQFSPNGGATFDAGASNYGYGYRAINQAGATGDAGATATSMIMTPTSVGNGAAEGLSGVIDVFDTDNPTSWTRALWHLAYIDNGGGPQLTHVVGGGARGAAQVTDALRLGFASSNIASGKWDLYGWN